MNASDALGVGLGVPGRGQGGELLVTFARDGRVDGHDGSFRDGVDQLSTPAGRAVTITEPGARALQDELGLDLDRLDPA